MALSSTMATLKDMKIVLASGSPSRKEVMKTNIGLGVDYITSNFDENLKPEDFSSIADFVEQTALGKVLEVEERLTKEGRAPDMVIGADTVVELNGKVLGKPKNEQDAFLKLSSLSGKANTVHTGVIIKYKKKVVKFTEHTKVFFGVLDADQINGYIATGLPMSKAGAYGIQDLASGFITRIEGSYTNILGLPSYRLCAEIKKLVNV